MSDVLVKQPGETLPYAIDFTNLLPTGDSISSVTSVTATPTGTGHLTIGTPTKSGTKVLFTIAGGTDGTAYKVQAIITSTQSYVIEGDGRLFVTELT